ncbi:MAG: MFS transporter [Breznakibacter sp.]
MISFDSFHTRRWYRVAASFFFFVQGITFASWASRIPDIKNLLGLSTGELGAVLFAMPMGQLSAMALSGYLVSRYGSKKMLTVAALVYPTALVGLGTVGTVWQLAIGLYAFGITGNLINISINTQGVGVERLYGRSIMASFHGIWSLAGFIGGLLSTVVVGYGITPLRHFLMVYAFALVVLLSFKNTLLPRDMVRREGSGPARIFARPDRFIALLGLIVFASMICEGAMFNWSSIYFEEVIKPNENLIRLGYIAFMSTMALGRLTADRIVNRLGIVTMLRASSLLLVSGFMLAVLVPTLVSATIGFLMIGFGTSSVVPLCYGMAGKSKKLLPGIALATVSTIGFMGFLIGPPVIGFVADMLSLQWSFALVAVLSLIPLAVAPKLMVYVQQTTQDEAKARIDEIKRARRA